MCVCRQNGRENHWVSRTGRVAQAQHTPSPFFFPLLRAQNKRRALRKKQEPVCHARDLGERVSSLTSNCAGDVRQSSGCVRTHIHEQKVSLSLCTGSLHPLGIVAYYLLYALSSINSATNPSTNSTTSSSFFFFLNFQKHFFGGTFHASLLRCSVVSRRKTTDCIQQSGTACNGVFFSASDDEKRSRCSTSLGRSK